MSEIYRNLMEVNANIAGAKYIKFSVKVANSIVMDVHASECKIFMSWNIKSSLYNKPKQNFV